tara:strand:+ start:1555 stop:1842 length:288 start_codon:yes stop_codon:yes gene_type:complete
MTRFNTARPDITLEAPTWDSVSTADNSTKTAFASAGFVEISNLANNFFFAFAKKQNKFITCVCKCKQPNSNTQQTTNSNNNRHAGELNAAEAFGY